MPPHPTYKVLRQASAICALACLASLTHCYGGWVAPLEPIGSVAQPATDPDATNMPTADGNMPADPNASVANPNTAAATDPNTSATNPNMGATNPNTADPNAKGTCQPIADYFTAQMWTPIMSTTCVSCHQDASNPFHLTAGDAAASLTATEAEAKKTGTNNTSLLLLKPTGQETHGGGMLFSTTSATYAAFQAFVTAVASGAQCVTSP